VTTHRRKKKIHGKNFYELKIPRNFASFKQVTHKVMSTQERVKNFSRLIFAWVFVFGGWRHLLMKCNFRPIYFVTFIFSLFHTPCCCFLHSMPSFHNEKKFQITEEKGKLVSCSELVETIFFMRREQKVSHFYECNFVFIHPWRKLLVCFIQFFISTQNIVCCWRKFSSPLFHG
jgi:hypothetical protein